MHRLKGRIFRCCRRPRYPWPTKSPPFIEKTLSGNAAAASQARRQSIRVARLENGGSTMEHMPLLTSPGELATLFLLYGLGFVMIVVLISLMYRHATRRAGVPGLSTLELHEAHMLKRHYAIFVAVGCCRCCWHGSASASRWPSRAGYMPWSAHCAGGTARGATGSGRRDQIARNRPVDRPVNIYKPTRFTLKRRFRRDSVTVECRFDRDLKKNLNELSGE